MPGDPFEKFYKEVVERYRKSPHYNSLVEKGHSFSRDLRRLFHALESQHFDLRQVFGLPPGIDSVRPEGQFLSADYPDVQHTLKGEPPQEYSGPRSISQSEYDQFLEEEIERCLDPDLEFLYRGAGNAVLGTLLSLSFDPAPGPTKKKGVLVLPIPIPIPIPTSIETPSEPKVIIPPTSESASKQIEAIPAVKANEVIPIHTPDSVKWEEVDIEFIALDTVKFHIGKIIQSRHYASLGLANLRKPGTYHNAWETLAVFARYNGRIEWETPIDTKIKKRLSTDVGRLRRMLQGVLGIPGDPFKFYRKEKAYQSKFMIRLSENMLGYERGPETD